MKRVRYLLLCIGTLLTDTLNAQETDTLDELLNTSISLNYS